jgi:hypothetical protein
MLDLRPNLLGLPGLLFGVGLGLCNLILEFHSVVV